MFSSDARGVLAERARGAAARRGGRAIVKTWAIAIVLGVALVSGEAAAQVTALGSPLSDPLSAESGRAALAFSSDTRLEGEYSGAVASAALRLSERLSLRIRDPGLVLAVIGTGGLDRLGTDGVGGESTARFELTGVPIASSAPFGVELGLGATHGGRALQLAGASTYASAGGFARFDGRVSGGAPGEEEVRLEMRVGEDFQQRLEDTRRGWTGELAVGVTWRAPWRHHVVSIGGALRLDGSDEPALPGTVLSGIARYQFTPLGDAGRTYLYGELRLGGPLGHKEIGFEGTLTIGIATTVLETTYEEAARLEPAERVMVGSGPEPRRSRRSRGAPVGRPRERW